MNQILNVVSDRSAVMTARKTAIKRLLTEPLVAGALEELRGEILVDWATSGPDDAARREQLYYEYTVFDKMVERLRTYANDVDFMKKDESDAP